MDSMPAHPDLLRIDKLFMPGNTIAWGFLSGFEWPWEALPGIRDCIIENGASLDAAEYNELPGNVWIHRTAVVAPTAFIGSHVIIGAGTQVRHCAFIRENALIGSGALVGNSSELKNAVLFDGAQAPHFNYVGDSILGHKAHMGAGAITSNVKGDGSPVSIACGDSRYETGLRKFGAILGDNAEIGCNAVLNPGCVIGPRSTVYPLCSVRGYVPPDSIFKGRGDVVKKR